MPRLGLLQLQLYWDLILDIINISLIYASVFQRETHPQDSLFKGGGAGVVQLLLLTFVLFVG